MDNQEIEIAQDSQTQAHIQSNKLDEYQVVLPCQVQDFRNFVAGLLGKPQVLNGELRGIFEIGTQEIENIYFLITQRINQQNDGSLIHFSISVFYNNGTSVSHNSLDAFHCYHPVDHCYPIGLILNFIYLINFPHKNVSEKQNIEVIIATDNLPGNITEDKHIGNGLYEYRIEYTDRTWATDISSLLKNHGKKSINNNNKFIKYFHENKEELFDPLFSLLLFTVIGFWFYHSYSTIDKLNFDTFKDVKLIKYFVGSFSLISMLCLFIYGIKSYFQYKYIVTQESFICLVENDIKNMRSRKNKLRKGIFLYITAWLVNVGASLFASYIYTKNFFQF